MVNLPTEKAKLGKELDYKVAELRTAENRLTRYWKKLVKSSITHAKALGIETYVLEKGDQAIHGPTRINVLVEGDTADSSELIGLSRDLFPLLYRKYDCLRKRSDKLREQLEGLLSAYRAH